MRRDIVTSAIGIVVLTVVLGVLYPLVVTGVSQVVFPGNANGQKVYVGVKPVGSKLIGQSFTTQVVKAGKPQTTKTKGPVLVANPSYFQSRPSATGEPYTNGGTPYNAAGTTFSNLGPNNTATEQAIAGNIQSYLALERPYNPGLSAARIPVDAVNSS
ncbi:MAG: potassium-transporting ATPase subunit C, partial [Pseudonocardiales bacterium]|nr:potassium-transporting ATPase subunit C [Pseudonocardiales bacterium]